MEPEAPNSETATVVGWKVDRDQRRELLQQFPARYVNVIADHVTLKVDAGAEPPLPGAAIGEIVGHADDGEGVEAMVMTIDGSTDRPDGGTWHITWSLAEGRQARESNDIIGKHGWAAFDLPMPVQLTPACWPRSARPPSLEPRLPD